MRILTVDNFGFMVEPFKSVKHREESEAEYVAYLQRAAKGLRTRLGLSQTEFGRRIGKTFNTVLMYENQKRLRGETLIPYAALALDAGYYDLAEIFRSAILKDLGVNLERIIQWQPGRTLPVKRIPSEQKPIVEAVVAFLNDRDLPPANEFLRGSLVKLLEAEYGLRKSKVL